MDEGARNNDGPAPDLLTAFKEIKSAGASGFAAFNDASKAMRTLLAAEVSLARSALGRTLALLGVAVSVGAAAVLMLMGALVAWLVQSRGLSLAVAMLMLGLVALVLALLAGWLGSRYFEHTRMKATRRQLARLGIGELADRTPDPGSAVSSKDAVENLKPAAADGAPVKDAQGIDITQP